MEKSLFDLFRMWLPLPAEKRRHVSALKEYLDKDELKYVKYLLRMRRVGVSYGSLGVDKSFVKEQGFPRIDKAVPDRELDTLIGPWNDRVERAAREEAYHDFAFRAAEVFPAKLAPHLVGFDDVRLAASWQLFAADRVHLLLLGDPGTGKTDVLRAAAQFAPVSSFGLGSGTSGAGLAAAKKAGKLEKGLLPLADKGLCCIDELNLMKPRDRGALLNAMEKGFVTYDKGGEHLQLPADVCVLATANPKGDRFIGSKVKFLKEQLPFDPALLSRFQLVFFVRKPGREEFLRITKSLIDKKQKGLKPADVEFLKGYVAYARKLSVEFDSSLRPVIMDFFEELKDEEDELLIELSPRLVLGVVRLAKAAARISLRTTVTHDDVAAVLGVLKRSLLISPDAKSKRQLKA